MAELASTLAEPTAGHWGRKQYATISWLAVEARQLQHLLILTHLTEGLAHIETEFLASC